MGLLIAGVIIWSMVHFVPSLAQPVKLGLINRIGENGYKAVFSLLMFAALALIIFGWRSAEPAFLYQLPVYTKHIAMLLIVIAFVLFGAANYPTRIKGFIRHPQLTGVAIWATAHLILNGDSRSLVLFGGLGIWAVLEILLINRREKEWVKPEAPSWAREIRGLIISIVIMVVVIFLHPYIAGVAIR